MNYRSDAPHPRPSRIRWTRRGRPVRRRSGRRLPRERPSLHGRSGRRWAVSRNQTSWFAAIAGAMTWLQVLSSGGIADAANVSVNAMGRWHGRGRRKLRSSLVHDVRYKGPGSKGLGPFSFRASSGARLNVTGNHSGGRNRVRPLGAGFRRASEAARGCS